MRPIYLRLVKPLKDNLLKGRGDNQMHVWVDEREGELVRVMASIRLELVKGVRLFC
jgi:hypothetical protein